MHQTQNVLHESPAFDVLGKAPPCRFVTVGAWSAPRGRDFAPHQHTVWELVYYREGCIRCPVGDVVYTGQPGTLLSTPPGVVHSEQAATAYANYYLQVDAPPNAPWPVICHDDSRQTLGFVFQSLLDESRSPKPYNQELIALLLSQVDLLLRRAQSAEVPSPMEQTVRHAERLFEERACKEPAPGLVGDVAHELGFCASSLRAYFAQCRGYSPRDALARIRARRAVALLQTSTLTLDAVASLCGYHSASHLSRHVKRWVNVSPGALRTAPHSHKMQADSSRPLR